MILLAVLFAWGASGPRWAQTPSELCPSLFLPALAAPPGPPFTIPSAIAAGVFGFAQIAKIKSTSFGGGGGGGGGGAPSIGGGAVAPSPPPPPVVAGITERATAEAAPTGTSINSQVSGFVGDEAALASALAPVIKEAQGDGVNFGLSGV